MTSEGRRARNEARYGDWDDGDRRYHYSVHGRDGWMARYVKEVDPEENTTWFLQEIYDHRGRLVEIHEKDPTHTGHLIVRGEG